MKPEIPTLPAVTSRHVQVGDLWVHVAEAGPPDAPPLVLLHGWPQHWWCWRHVVPLLADSYRLVMPDLRGHGWTDAPRQGYDKEQMATDVLATMDALDIRSAGLVGHDWGGWIAFLAALRRPERFTGLLALGITHPFQHLDLARVLQGWRGSYQLALSTPVLAQAVLRTSPWVVEQAIKRGSVRQDAHTPEDLRIFSAVLQQPDHARASVSLYRTFVLREAGPVMAGRYRGQRLTVPTRVVGGAADPVITPALLEGYQAYADDLTVHVLDGVGHFVPEEAPVVVAEQIRQLFPLPASARST
jgi:pimeloyl-ACP methyl ester carboxylesterase